MISDKICKRIKIVLAVFILIGGLGCGSYYFIRNNNYNKLIENANQYMKDGEYDKALALFEESMNYKNDSAVEENIQAAKSLVDSTNIYNEGIALMEKGNYYEAIEKFKGITNQSEDIYIKAQEKIKESTDKDKSFNVSEDQKVKEQETESKSEESKKITPLQAEVLVKKLVVKNSGTKSEYDHDETKGGIYYYVIHVYDVVEDHTATMGWFYVNPSTSKVYDGTMGALELIN